TPFGFGRPYSQGQLETQLKLHNFLPERQLTSLYQPPSAKRFWRKTAPIWERVGRAMPLVGAGGVIMLEATKRVHAPTGGGLRERVKRPLTVLAPKGETAPV